MQECGKILELCKKLQDFYYVRNYENSSFEKLWDFYYMINYGNSLCGKLCKFLMQEILGIPYENFSWEK